MTRRRLCRAFECPRHVDDRVLFCNVHWNQLGPRYQAPIASNIEAPVRATVDGARTVITGVAAAQQYLAKKEGRARSLQTAVQIAATTPVTGADTSTSGSGTVGVGGAIAGSTGSTGGGGFAGGGGGSGTVRPSLDNSSV